MSVQVYGDLPPEAVNRFEYAVPSVAPETDVVVMLSGGGAEVAVMVTADFPDLVGSATLVAVTVALVLALTVGAVYRPVFEIVPGEADQVTATFDVLLTRAVNCAVAAEDTVAVAGVTVTATLAAFDTVTWNEFLPACELESVAETAKLKDPVWLGVPEMVPVVSPRSRPEGSWPDATVKW